MDLIHPEKRETLFGNHGKKLREVWRKIVDGRRLDDFEDFKSAFVEYVMEVESLVQSYPAVLPQRDKFKDSPLWNRVMLKMESPYIVMDWLAEQIGVPSFPLLGIDPRMELIQLAIADSPIEGIPLAACSTSESRLTDIVVRHACYFFNKYGRKAYRVSPGLQWMLENTELRRYPADDLRLPYPTIYISLPPKYRVYNELTGWHLSEGMYVVEDVNTIPRCWRLVLAAKPHEDSQDEFDDAIYHWLIHFPEGATVEESIKESIDVVYKQHDAREYERTLIMLDGTTRTFKSALPPKLIGDGRLEIFEQMQATMLPLFRYVMNVVLYSTLPDADVVFSDANPEYSSLRRRAQREKNERKRKELNARANALGAHPRILLGGSIVVSREMKESADGDGTGRKQRVRSLVSGHWHHFWTGPRKEQDKRALVKKWVQPYWRGPEAAPLTTKEHVLK